MIWETVNEKKRKEVRNKWYKLGYALSDNDGKDKLNNIAIKTGFINTDSLTKWMKTWGNKMVELYGKLPYCILNSKSFEKYMEVK